MRDFLKYIVSKLYSNLFQLQQIILFLHLLRYLKKKNYFWRDFEISKHQQIVLKISILKIIKMLQFEKQNTSFYKFGEILGFLNLVFINLKLSKNMLFQYTFMNHILNNI